MEPPYFSRITGGDLCKHPPPPPLGRPKMLCWLAFGEHEAIFLEENGGRPMQTPSAAPLGRPKMLCWLAFGEHEALKRDMNGVRILIPA